MTTASSTGIGDKARSSAKWYFAFQFLQKFLFFGSSIVLARLLSHADFGLAALSLTLDSFTWLIISLGVNSALIHYQDDLENRLNAAFWMFMVAGIIMTIALIVVAPYIAKFYKSEMFIPIVRYSAFSVLIYSIGAVHKTLLYKNIDFKRVSLIEGGLNIVKNALFVILAFAGFKVWSFIYPKIIISALSTIVLWKMIKWRPKFEFNFHYWGEMFHYGKNVLCGNIIDFFLNNASQILIGGMVGSTLLGVYTFAYDKSMMTVNNISYPVMAITFPAFSKLQNELEKLRNAFFKTVRMVAFITIPYTISQIVLGHEYITVIFGPKWASSIFIFQVLLVFTMMRSICHSGNSLLQGLGRPDIVLKWNLSYAPIYLTSIYLGYKLHGIYGVAVAVSITGVISSIIYLIMLAKVLKCPPLTVIKIPLPSFICSLIAGVVMFALKELFLAYDISKILILIISNMAGIIAYFLSMRLIFKGNFNFIIYNLKQFIGKKERKNVIQKEELTQQKT
jgi:PST family polysaccharide transporter